MYAIVNHKGVVGIDSFYGTELNKFDSKVAAEFFLQFRAEDIELDGKAIVIEVILL